MRRPCLNVKPGIHCGFEVVGAACESEIGCFIAPTQSECVNMIELKAVAGSASNLGFWINVFTLITRSRTDDALCVNRNESGPTEGYLWRYFGFFLCRQS